MKSEDRSAGSVAGKVPRRRGRDPRRFPGLLLVHVFLILVCLAVACAAVALRSIGGGRALSVVLPRPARASTVTDPPPTLGPLAAPPAPPVSLDAALAARGYELPEHSDVYAVRIGTGPDGPVYQHYQAGGGALAEDFWPASSIKVLAALGALDFARSLGFTGAATVTFAADDGSTDSGGGPRTLRSMYEAAVRDSSNYDYDQLVRIAGVDRLNSQFLTARNGFPATAITRPYDGTDLDSPPMTLEEGGKRTDVPARPVELKPKCEAGNCSNLFEMAESVRRVVLDDELPPGERFDLDAADIADLRQALLDAEGFFPPAVGNVLGDGARIFDKPGDAADYDCLDVALIEPAGGPRYLLAATVPHSSGGCDALVSLAAEVLELLAA
jgi:hypothetical protein